jgi:hypothetical protein
VGRRLTAIDRPCRDVSDPHPGSVDAWLPAEYVVVAGDCHMYC